MADPTAEYRLILQEEYKRRSLKNRRFTQSAFARQLGLERTYFSKLLAGKILLSLDLADQVTRKLKLDEPTRRVFLLSAADEQRCHALYLVDPSLTDCEPEDHEMNTLPKPRRKAPSRPS